MLDIWVLNVGHGDSIVLHYRTEFGNTFAVIDSNWNGKGVPRALTKLQELGAEKLSFVALTHPHFDHYTGLSEILKHYKGKISNFYSFPFSPFLNDRLKKLGTAYADVYKKTDSVTVRRQLIEFLAILNAAKEEFGEHRWIELTGEYNDFMPKGFSGVDIISVLPPAKVKGDYIQMIESGSCEIVGGRLKENELSTAFLIRYNGSEVLLGGDGTRANWTYHAKQWARKPRTMEAVVAKLPHHGSNQDCANSVLQHIFNSEGCAAGVISANGRSHPHKDVLARLNGMKIFPYCTNLSVECGAKFRERFSDPDLSPRLVRYIASILTLSNTEINPCQGDICISMADDGDVQVQTQYNHPCPYRGGLESIA